MAALNAVADVVVAPPGLLPAPDLLRERMRISRHGSGLPD
jgi:hypothetical protein